MPSVPPSHIPLSLPHLLASNKSLPAPPQTHPLICLSPSTLHSLKAPILTPLLLHNPPHCTVALAWPLVLPDTYAALEPSTLQALHLTPAPPPKTARRKSAKRASNLPAPPPPSLSFSTLAPPQPASRVVLHAPHDTLFASPEYHAYAKRALFKRHTLPGALVVLSALGAPVTLHVAETTPPQHVRITNDTTVHLYPPKVQSIPPTLLLESIGGLDPQIDQLKRLMLAALKPDPTSFHSFVTKPPQGTLLFGPAGTGKTMLSCAMPPALGFEMEVMSGAQVVGQSSAEVVSKIESVFQRARSKAPCVIVLDEVDIMAPKRDAADTEEVQRKATATLLNLMDGEMEGVFVIGTTSRIEALDGAMRRGGRFDREIECGVPNEKGRYEILRKLGAEEEEARRVVTRCEGFVGADLAALWREGGKGGMEDAVGRIRPSGLREILVEIPKTKWEDIGGMDEVKSRLRECVEWPMRGGREILERVGVGVPRGVLLYGPPGCSKTMLARAVATESGMNFVSVKGGEVMSKWVGESEKAVRRIFEKARLARPCVVFLDEVDALAGKRTGGVQGRVVSQLLVEIDAGGVVVIAATNRPDCLDEAFVRGGRMDRWIYVGLPDLMARVAILKVCLRGVAMRDVNVELIAENCGGFSGAEVAALVREAGLIAMEKDLNAEYVGGKEFEEALKRVKPRTSTEVLEYFERFREDVEKKRKIGLY